MFDAFPLVITDAKEKWKKTTTICIGFTHGKF
jgi:hypothetical protein